MSRKLSKKDLTKKYFEKWLNPLGLQWWDITIVYYSEPQDILEYFQHEGSVVVPFTNTTHWEYGTSVIRVNVHALETMEDNEIETGVVHELVHTLVNEMRENEMHHEERVVTGLTKAFLWVSEGVGEKKASGNKA